MSDRLAIMREGRIVDSGPPLDVYLNPRSSFSARFVGQINVVPGDIAAAQPGIAEMRTQTGSLRGRLLDAIGEGPAEILIRPEHAVLRDADAPDPDQNSLNGVVTKRQFSGRFIEYEVKTSVACVKVTQDASDSHDVGNQVKVVLPIEHCVVVGTS